MRKYRKNPLQMWFTQIPYGDRGEVLERFIAAHKLNSTSSCYRFIANHPMTVESLEITEEFTEYKVTRYELFPDHFDRSRLEYINQKKNLI